jgi:uncharacterized protein (DUF1800 family)
MLGNLRIDNARSVITTVCQSVAIKNTHYEHDLQKVLQDMINMQADYKRKLAAIRDEIDMVQAILKGAGA